MRNYTHVARLMVVLVLTISVISRSQSIEDQQLYRQKLATAGHDTAKVLALLDYGETFFSTNYDTAEYYYRKAGDLALQINFTRGYHKYLSYLSGVYNMRGEYDKNIALCRNGYDLATKQNIVKSQGVHLSNISNSYLYMGQFDSAAWYMVKASTFFEQCKDSMTLGQVYSNLSQVFDNMKRYDQSLFYSRQALRIANNTGDELGVGYALNNIGATMKRQSRFDSADYYFIQAYPIARKYKVKDLELTIVVNLGMMASKNKRFDEAENYLRRSLQLSREMKHDYGVVNAIKGLVVNSMAQDKFDDAINYANEAILIAEKNGFRSELSELYKLVFESARSDNNHLVALDAYQKHIGIKDSLSNLEVQNNIAQLEKQYQSERKERMILARDNEIKSQQILLQSKNTWIIVLISFVVLAALVTLLIAKINKQKRLAELRQQELLKVTLSMQAKEEERHRIAKELHDDLGGTLSGIVVQTHFMSQQVEHHNVTALQKSIDKIGHAASEMITKLNDIIWLVNPRFDTLEKLVQRIEEFAMDMAKAKGMELRIDTMENIEDLSLDTQARKNIYLICKEAINNAVKYSQASELYFGVDKSGAELKLLIEDNGQGFDATRIREGNGLINMKERAVTIGANYSIDASGKKGTRVSLNYKIPQ